MTDQSEKIAELEQRIVDLNEQEAELCMLYGIARQESFSLSARVKDLEAQFGAERRGDRVVHGPELGQVKPAALLGIPPGEQEVGHAPALAGVAGGVSE